MKDTVILVPMAVIYVIILGLVANELAVTAWIAYLIARGH